MRYVTKFTTYLEIDHHCFAKAMPSGHHTGRDWGPSYPPPPITNGAVPRSEATADTGAVGLSDPPKDPYPLTGPGCTGQTKDTQPNSWLRPPGFGPPPTNHPMGALQQPPPVDYWNAPNVHPIGLVDLVCKSLPHVRVRSEQTMECFQNPRRPHRWHVTLARFSNYDRTHRTHVTSALVMKKIRPYLASQKSHDQTWTHATKRTRNRLRTRKRVPNPSRNNNLAKSRNKKHCNNRKPKHRKHAIARKLNFMAFKNKFKTSHHCLVCDQLAQLMMPLCHPRTNLTTSPLPRSQATTSELGVN